MKKYILPLVGTLLSTFVSSSVYAYTMTYNIHNTTGYPLKIGGHYTYCTEAVNLPSYFPNDSYITVIVNVSDPNCTGIADGTSADGYFDYIQTDGTPIGCDIRYKNKGIPITISYKPAACSGSEMAGDNPANPTYDVEIFTPE